MEDAHTNRAVPAVGSSQSGEEDRLRQSSSDTSRTGISAKIEIRTDWPWESSRTRLQGRQSQGIG